MTSRLPNFIIAGERRAGTTTLYNAMAQHPAIGLLKPADASFFTDDLFASMQSWDDRRLVLSDWDEQHSLTEYLALFRHVDGQSIGHKGADLLFWTPAHERMMRFVPNIKLLVVLRDPTNRAASHYLNEVSKGRETLPFAPALAVEEDRARLSAYAHFHYSYRERGFYHASLERLFDVVPRSQVHVIIFEELVKEPRRTLNEIFEFVGVDPLPAPILPHSNPNAAVRARPIFERPGLQRVVAFNKRVTNAAVSRTVRQNDRKIAWRRRLNSATHQTLTRSDLPTAEMDTLREAYHNEAKLLSQLLDRDIAAW